MADQAEMTVRPFLTSATDESNPAFSPDGKTVAFSWDGEDGSNSDIYIKLVDAGDPLRLTTDPAPDVSPAWSPHGKFIAFRRRLSQDRLQILTVPALGGPERKLTEQRQLAGILTNYDALSWHPSGKSIAFDDAPDGELQGILSARPQFRTTAAADHFATRYGGRCFTGFFTGRQNTGFPPVPESLSWPPRTSGRE